MMIRLTEWEIIEELETKATDIYSEHEIVAQAQLRKDYEWLTSKCDGSHHDARIQPVRMDCSLCMQAMKKEAQHDAIS